MSTVNEAETTTSTTATDLASYQQFALEQQAQNNAWSAQQAQKQMDFQREMSGSAHQREVADLKAAGLNPILSANSGASVPNGAAGDTDTSAAANVGGILQQVLQAQSAREVAGMYNAATIAAATIAANASMYGSDMNYWNTEDHPKSIKEWLAWMLAQGSSGSHAPGTNSSPHDNSTASSAKASTASGSSYTYKPPNPVQTVINTFKNNNDISRNYLYARNSYNGSFIRNYISKMGIANRNLFNAFLVRNGYRNGIQDISNIPLTKFISLYSNFVKTRKK